MPSPVEASKEQKRKKKQTYADTGRSEFRFLQVVTVTAVRMGKTGRVRPGAKRTQVM